jgi:hypothetical protein
MKAQASRLQPKIIRNEQRGTRTLYGDDGDVGLTEIVTLRLDDIEGLRACMTLMYETATRGGSAYDWLCAVDEAGLRSRRAC